MLFPITVSREVVPLGGEYHLDDDGFRSDASAAGQLPLANIALRASVAVLGEPGIGKSRAVRELTSNDSTVIDVGLDTVADVHDLCDRLAAVAAAVDEGIPPDLITVVLDSIDECPISTKVLLHHLEETLCRHPTPRVVLGCRTADWPETLSTRLQALLPRFDVYELLPLGRADIAELAATRGVDGSSFLTAVVDAAAVPLASLPLTLDLLLSTYQQSGRLPASADELYEQGALRLAEEPEPDRPSTKKPAGTAPQRLAVAAKLAAYTMLCGRSAITRAVPAAADALLAGALAGGTESVDGGDFSVTAELLDAALATALFNGRGPGRLGVVHASIAAYLTARYLTFHAVPEHQLRALLTRTNTLSRTRVPSRLRETAAWLVALDPERNGWLVDVDPDTVAAHAGLVNDAAVRSRLTAYLLESPDPDLRMARRRWRLAHPGLAEQLRPALRAPLTEDAGPNLGHPISRRAWVAVEIARRAGGDGSVLDLVELVLSSRTNSYLRSAAAHALIDLDAAIAAQTLLTVLDEVGGHPDHDPDDELRGLALKMNWPANLSAGQLLPALNHPQNSNLIGSYAMFLAHFLDKVSDQVITDLLRSIAPHNGTSSETEQEWVDEEAPPCATTAGPAAPFALLTGTRRGQRVMISLLSRALESTQLDRMIDEVGWLLAAAIRQHHDIVVPDRFDDDVDSDPSAAQQLRRALILAALRHLPVERAGLLVIRTRRGAPGGLLRSEDLEWLLKLGGTEWATHAAELIRLTFDATDVRQQELVWAHRDEPIFNDSVGRWFDAVALDSPEAARMREVHAWRREPDRGWDGTDAHEPALHAAWALCKEGDPDGFLALCGRLRINPESGDVTTSDDLEAWPSYPLLDIDHEVLRASAERYLREADPGEGDWRDVVGTLPGRAFVGYVALAYLTRTSGSSDRLDAMPQLWQRWTRTILWIPSGLVDRDLHATLRAKAQQQEPDEYRRWMLRHIEMTARSGWLLDPLDELAAVYDDTTGARLDGILHGVIDLVTSIVADLHQLGEPLDDRDTPRPSVNDLHGRLSAARGNGTVLGAFLAPRHDPTRTWLREVADGTTVAPVEVRVLAAETLLAAGLLGGDDILTGLQDDEKYGRALALALTSGRSMHQVVLQWTDSQLTKLWWWLDARWSSQSDTFGDGFVSDDERVRNLRNGIVAELATRATPEALTSLARLLASRPDDYRLQAALADAEARDRDESWRGVEVAELTALLDNARRTLVHDDDALYRAVLASLDRFAARMRDIGQTMWNETRPKPAPGNGVSKVWNPKYEPDVSAVLRDHLQQEFGEQLVVNREVLVRQTSSKGHGLAVDVLPTGTETSGGTRLPN
ncbi:hypothetical protein L603_003900000020 [Cellulosimicrobium cellulans J34]|nr:hypothetical protein L603_003900000020 [Cellulosimicrobium cellulans J34]SMF42887.1 hypothetical protein SAMN02744115_03262 [Cellulosimicrobium cellulans J1]